MPLRLAVCLFRLIHCTLQMLYGLNTTQMMIFWRKRKLLTYSLDLEQRNMFFVTIDWWLHIHFCSAWLNTARDAAVCIVLRGFLHSVLLWYLSFLDDHVHQFKMKEKLLDWNVNCLSTQSQFKVKWRKWCCSRLGGAVRVSVLVLTHLGCSYPCQWNVCSCSDVKCVELQILIDF